MKLPKYLGGHKCRKTGEYRVPLPGEFYVTGALPVVFRAEKPMELPFHIVEVTRHGPPA